MSPPPTSSAHDDDDDDDDDKDNAGGPMAMSQNTPSLRWLNPTGNSALRDT
jgi:hypothetical protein